MSQRLRQSSRGNPYHYPAGTPRGGQFAPKDYAEAAAIACGHYFADRDVFDAYSETEEFRNEHETFYHDDRTADRFSKEPTEQQIAEAKNIHSNIKNRGGEAPPEGGTTSDYEDYITRNRIFANTPTDKQAAAIQYIEDKFGVEYSSDDKYGGNAGSMMGAGNTASDLLQEASWEKDGDGCICARLHPTLKDGSSGTRNLGYRMEPFHDENGKVRYHVQKKVPVGKNKDGKTIKEWKNIDEIPHEPKTRSSYASNPKEGRSVAAAHALARYAVKNGQTKKGIKRSRKQQARSIKHLEAMGSLNSWNQDSNGTYRYGYTYDDNNHYDWTISRNDDGTYTAYRTITNVQSMNVYDKTTGKMNTEKVPRERTEYIGKHFDSIESAQDAVITDEANNIVHKRFQGKINSKAIKEMKKEGIIKQERLFNKFLSIVPKK